MESTTLKMPVGIGRIVHYRLSEQDADRINEVREAPNENANHAEAGQVYPAMIVRLWGEPENPQTAVNLQVFIDGDFTYWATSRCQDASEDGAQPGCWVWPMLKTPVKA